ncbi:MAG: class I SAM-dependent methyltransferase [Nitrospira sp.]|nr:class I SAM-dependent methyltransferase [Nitrospira sp.]
MDPTQTARNYDAIASWWLQQMKDSTYGLAALERAITSVGAGRYALDVGCGCEGRFLRTLLERGFDCSGLDISREMIALAKQRYSEASFVVGDICGWPLPRRYDLITAWDSTFHLPLENQEPVLLKLCEGLSPDGVLLFTCGDGKEPGSIQGEFGGKRFEYSSLGVSEFVRILSLGGCAIQHLERDQYPLNHVYIVAKKL